MKIDILNNKKHAYLIGLIQTDGSIYETTRNRGKITLEINKKDDNILKSIKSIIECNVSIIERTRNININAYEYISNTTVLSIFDLETRNEFKKYIPIGKKSNKIEKPENIIEIDYWRGIIDGDGSLGFTKKGIPFISLITCSDKLAEQFIDFLYNIIGYKKLISRNKRDKAYNIMITNENSQKIIKLLYYKNCICINRKYELAQKILNWERPVDIKKIDFERKKWTDYEDDFIINHDITESIDALKRTEKSIKMRLFRLKLKQ